MEKKTFFCILNFIIIFSFTTYAFGRASSVNADTIKRKLVAGEELTYLVKYAFINIGEVKIVTQDQFIKDGKKFYKTLAYIDSYEGLPFVDLHQVYESVFSENLEPVYFKGTMFEEDTTFTEYFFNYENSTIRIRKGSNHPYKIWTDSVAHFEKIYQDGLSIFFYARMGFGKEYTDEIPCFVAEKKEKTVINFFDDIVDVSIDAVDYDIACLKLEGYTDFISVFGLTGEFSGWFTNDEASIPVAAKMNVIIGSIYLELIDWKREGWKPPAYKN
ncbi:MAG: hypothetical protein Kow0098_20830 [Ignavibacteriaceae bacterium]